MYIVKIVTLYHKCYKCIFFPGFITTTILVLIILIIILVVMGVEHRVLHILSKCSMVVLCSHHLKDPYFIFNLLEMSKVFFVILFSKGHDELYLSPCCLILASHTGLVPFLICGCVFLRPDQYFSFPEVSSTIK